MVSSKLLPLGIVWVLFVTAIGAFHLQPPASPSPSKPLPLQGWKQSTATRLYSSKVRRAEGDCKGRLAFLWSRALHGVILPLLVLSTSAPGARAAERGQVLFDNNCSSCHVGGGNVIGYARGKTLQADALKKNKYDNKQSIVNLLEQGKGVMPKYSSYVRKNGEVAPARLSTQEMEAVANYVLQQAATGWK